MEVLLFDRPGRCRIPLHADDPHGRNFDLFAKARRSEAAQAGRRRVAVRHRAADFPDLQHDPGADDRQDHRRGAASSGLSSGRTDEIHSGGGDGRNAAGHHSVPLRNKAVRAPDRPYGAGRLHSPLAAAPSSPAYSAEYPLSSRLAALVHARAHPKRAC